MNKKDLMRTNATSTAMAIVNLTNDNNILNKHPFVPGWQTRSQHLQPLIDNIEELYKHPRKNAELIYFLNELKNSYYL